MYSRSLQYDAVDCVIRQHVSGLATCERSVCRRMYVVVVPPVESRLTTGVMVRVTVSMSVKSKGGVTVTNSPPKRHGGQQPEMAVVAIMDCQ